MTRQFLRLGLSFVLAFAVVGALAIVAINIYFERPGFTQVGAFRVERADPELVEQLRARERGEEPDEDAGQTDLQWPPKPHSGFVQLRFDVLPDGRAANIEVVGAAPAGYFEDQARARIAGRRYLPRREDGVAVTSTRTEIVDFEFVPAAR